MDCWKTTVNAGHIAGQGPLHHATNVTTGIFLVLLGTKIIERMLYVRVAAQP
jgi:hypothetical protein